MYDRGRRKRHPSTRRAPELYPQYEALTFTQGGRTCYGVKSVRRAAARQ